MVLRITGRGQEFWEGDMGKVTDGQRKTCLEPVHESSTINQGVYSTVAATSFYLPKGKTERQDRHRFRMGLWTF